MAALDRALLRLSYFIMTIDIKIECNDDLQHVKTHLSAIRQSVIKAIKKQKKLLSQGGETSTMDAIADSNCYGDHNVQITYED